MSNTARNAISLLREQGLTQRESERKLAADAYNKYHKGDHISDEELRCGIKVIGDVVDFLEKINDRKLDLFENRLAVDLNSFKKFQEARKVKPY